MPGWAAVTWLIRVFEAVTLRGRDVEEE